MMITSIFVIVCLGLLSWLAASEPSDEVRELRGKRQDLD